eukprot:TRINITY_DN8018_c0_g2_i1.p1 TRINITY_DN8018_c0_g2~~TRINITY_DN8018_c0_g2_i1.p1  ORF type:complete len:282 (+),score=3.80 TRINITY_DN8018_c0_g2_i1:2-847(+)
MFNSLILPFSSNLNCLATSRFRFRGQHNRLSRLDFVFHGCRRWQSVSYFKRCSKCDSRCTRDFSCSTYTRALRKLLNVVYIQYVVLNVHSILYVIIRTMSRLSGLFLLLAIVLTAHARKKGRKYGITVTNKYCCLSSKYGCHCGFGKDCDPDVDPDPQPEPTTPPPTPQPKPEPTEPPPTPKPTDPPLTHLPQPQPTESPDKECDCQRSIETLKLILCGGEKYYWNTCFAECDGATDCGPYVLDLEKIEDGRRTTEGATITTDYSPSDGKSHPMDEYADWV